ncbi:MAG: hypothetical protein RLZ28_1272 [Actinomycetota bacterium]|jgi:hypothetical protein
MRLRQGPLLEASIIYVVSTIVSLVVLIATFGANFGAVTNTFTLEAIFLLLPSFVLWAISGQFLKGRSAIARFFTQITINSIIGVVALILTNQVVNAVEDSSRATVTASMYAVVVAYYLGTLAGSAVCNFWYVLVTNRRS